MSENYGIDPNTQVVPQFSRKHAAYLIGVSNRTVRRWIDDNKIFAYKVGNREAWYIPLPEINKMRKKHAHRELTAREALEIMERY